MRRLLVAVVGVLLAFLAGCCFLTTALLIESLAVPAQTSLALFNVAVLLMTSLPGGGTAHLVGAGLMAIWLALLAVCFAPVALVAILGEVAGLRSIVWFAGGTGAAAACVPTILRAVADGQPRVAPSPTEGRATLILFLTGLASGFVYWLVAGRGARAGMMR